MKLEMEGREPYIVLFGIPAVTAAIVLGSMYLGRMQADIGPPPSVYVEPKLTFTPRITAEIPQGAVHAEVNLPPAQIHEIIREVVKVSPVNIVNKVEPTPVQVNFPSTAASAEPRFIVIPAPLPVPITAAAGTAPVKPEAPVAQQTAKPATPLPTTATTTETAQAPAPPLPATPPPTTVQPTPVSTGPSVGLVEPDAEGKLLPPPKGVGGQPKPQ